MPIVYLPMGYPQLSGSFETIIYQGQVVRMYTGVTDPRTGDQTFRRKLYSDIARMRASAKDYPKAAWKLQFGRTWGTVIMQICLSDADSLWSTAWDEWDGMSTAQKEYLNLNAPYVATWLEPGRIFWALYQTLWRWADARGGNKYNMPEITAQENDAGYTWWASVLADHDLQAYKDLLTWYDNIGQTFSKSGTWSNWSGAGPRDNTLAQCSSVGGYAEVLPKFNQAVLWYAQNTDTGLIGIFFDQGMQDEQDTNGVLTWQKTYAVGHVRPAHQPLRFVHNGPSGKLIDVDGVELAIVNKGYYLEREGAGWIEQSNAGAAFGYYDLNLTGWGAGYWFNFVGRYAVLYFPKRPEFSYWSIEVDGQYYPGCNAYNGTELQRQTYVIGPLTKGLHRVHVWTTGQGVAVDEIKIRNYKADL
jgi:hypothetical protein